MKKHFLTVSGLLLSAWIFAQEEAKDIDVDITSDGANEGWYMSPWVWVVAAAVFILLIVALTSGSRSRTTRTTSGNTDKVTVTKTVRRDTDVD